MDHYLEQSEDETLHQSQVRPTDEEQLTRDLLSSLEGIVEGVHPFKEVSDQLPVLHQV